MKALLGLAWVASLVLAPHPLHLGVLELNWRPADGRLEVMVKLFRDDLAAALSRFHGRRIGDDLAGVSSAELLAYVESRLRIEAGGQRLRLTYVGREPADEADWLYFEAPCRQLRPLRVDNRLLFELFDDQDHFVHVTENGRQRQSFRLHVRQPQVVIE